MAHPGPACSWCDSEIIALIAVWSQPAIQTQLAGSLRNLKVFEVISRKLGEVGIQRTPVQCRQKVKKLKMEWRRISEYNQQEGGEKKGWKFWELMSSVMAKGQPHGTEMFGQQITENNRPEPEDDSTLTTGDSHLESSYFQPPLAIDIKTEFNAREICSLSALPTPSASEASTQVGELQFHEETERPFREETLPDYLHRYNWRRTRVIGRKRKRGRSPVLGSYLDRYFEYQMDFHREFLAWEERQRQRDAEAEAARRTAEQEHELRLMRLFGDIIKDIVHPL